MKNEIYSKVFMWLFVGLAITYATGYFLSINPTMIETIITSGMFWIVVLAELGIAIFFGVRVHKMSYTTAMICYIIYSFMTGITFSLLFIAYELTSIISIFAITSGLFLVFGLYGYYTKRSLNNLGTLLFMGLLGVIIASIIGIFVQNSMYFAVLDVICVLIFIGYIAYDIKRIEYLSQYISEDKVAVYGAFQLYLDFINLFIHLLELFGKNND